MKKLLLALLCFYGFCGFSQTATISTTSSTPTVSDAWTKTDRSNMFEDCMGYVTKYKGLTSDQKESVSLCYLDEITKKFSRNDFQSKIEIEIKRIKDATINQCAKNLGIELTTEVKQDPPQVVEKVIEKVIEPVKESIPVRIVPTKANLIGRWKTDKSDIIEFREDGGFSQIYANTSDANGDWFLDDKGVLTIHRIFTYKQLLTNKQKSFDTTEKCDFQYFSKDYLKYTTGALTIQANRIN